VALLQLADPAVVGAQRRECRRGRLDGPPEIERRWQLISHLARHPVGLLPRRLDRAFNMAHLGCDGVNMLCRACFRRPEARRRIPVHLGTFAYQPGDFPRAEAFHAGAIKLHVR
jgi:hypothetical protein